MNAPPQSPPNEALLEQARRGTPDAFWSLVQPHERMVNAVAIGIMRDTERAHDVVQDTWIRAFSTIGNLRDGSRVGAWLATMARHVASEHIRRNDRQIRQAQQTPTANVVSVPDLLIHEEELQQLNRHLEQLPESYRVILSMKYMANLSCKDIAEALGIGVEAAKSRLFEARRTLRVRMTAEVETATPPAAQRNLP